MTGRYRSLRLPDTIAKPTLAQRNPQPRTTLRKASVAPEPVFQPGSLHGFELPAEDLPRLDLGDDHRNEAPSSSDAGGSIVEDPLGLGGVTAQRSQEGRWIQALSHVPTEGCPTSGRDGFAPWPTVAKPRFVEPHTHVWRTRLKPGWRAALPRCSRPRSTFRATLQPTKSAAAHGNRDDRKSRTSGGRSAPGTRA